MWPFNKKRVKNIRKFVKSSLDFSSPKEKSKNIKSWALSKIRKTKIKNNKRYDPKLIYDLIQTYRTFIEKKYHIKKGLTHHELSKEIKERRIRLGLKRKIIYLSALINDIEYGDKEIDKKLLEEMIKELETIIK